MDMAFTTISTMLTTIHSSILGDGDMVGRGDLGAAGMVHSGDGIILMLGAIGDGDLDGTMDTMPGITDVIPKEVEDS